MMGTSDGRYHAAQCSRATMSLTEIVSFLLLCFCYGFYLDYLSQILRAKPSRYIALFCVCFPVASAILEQKIAVATSIDEREWP